MTSIISSFLGPVCQPLIIPRRNVLCRVRWRFGTFPTLRISAGIGIEGTSC